MCLSIFDLPSSMTEEQTDKLKNVLQRETLFGAGVEFKNPMDDEVLARKEFYEIKMLKSLHSKAAKQIGSSGSGNHFVEFGVVEINEDGNKLKLGPGKYLALLSHSGSRGLGATIAGYYTKVAMEKCKLPGVARHLAWLDLDSEEGQEYWLAMNLAGDYASACHHQIHKKVKRSLGAQLLASVENHHNFAWKEMYDGREVIVHRKGATPAGEGVLGIIPGSMVDPGFIVSGAGDVSSISSAAHGAGRKMSRTAAKSFINEKMMNDILLQHSVTLIGGDRDEAPMAYKDIRAVMQSQEELVNIEGIFHPRIVRMNG
jgi:tRNA-splicing ligase RtcB